MCSKRDFRVETLLGEIEPMYEVSDPAHDFSHAARVYKNAQRIGMAEGADMDILLLAALLHDAGSGPKNSEMSAESDSMRLRIVEDFLVKHGLPEDFRKKVIYAIDVHPFSMGIAPYTREARILQDADRLDAMGAVGIARIFMTGGSLGRKLYDPDDPFCKARELDDKRWNLDHFYRKILKLELGMHTETARSIAMKRAMVLRRYLADLQEEIEGYENLLQDAKDLGKRSLESGPTEA